MKRISLDTFLRLRKLVFRSARPLDYTKWKYLFENGSSDDFLSVLAAYQNEDGGFGYEIECNNWNPHSSPYSVCIALDYLDVTEDRESGIKNRIIAGIVKYLSSGAYLLDDGWVGMQGIPDNNDFAHMPWFHYNAEKAAKADIGVTKRLSDFILAYADRDSDLYRKAEGLKERYRQCGQVLLHGYPDYDPIAAAFIRSVKEQWRKIWTRLLIRCFPRTSFSCLPQRNWRHLKKAILIRTASGGAWRNRRSETIIGIVILSYAIWIS